MQPSLQNLDDAWDCFKTFAEFEGGIVKGNSAYRPPSYQKHLQDVWNTYMKLPPGQDPDCSEIREEAKDEFKSHGLLPSQPPVNSSTHSLGWSFDASIRNLDDATIDGVADMCNLTRPLPKRDGVHFNLKPAFRPQ